MKISKRSEPMKILKIPKLEKVKVYLKVRVPQIRNLNLKNHMGYQEPIKTSQN